MRLPEIVQAGRGRHDARIPRCVLLLRCIRITLAFRVSACLNCGSHPDLTQPVGTSRGRFHPVHSDRGAFP